MTTDGQVFSQSGGTTWTLIMFERQLLGEDYGAKQAHPIPFSPSGAPLSDSLCVAKSGWVHFSHRLPEAEGRRAVKMASHPRGVPPILSDWNSENRGASNAAIYSHLLPVDEARPSLSRSRVTSRH